MARYWWPTETVWRQNRDFKKRPAKGGQFESRKGIGFNANLKGLQVKAKTEASVGFLTSSLTSLSIQSLKFKVWTNFAQWLRNRPWSQICLSTVRRACSVKPRRLRFLIGRAIGFEACWFGESLKRFRFSDQSGSRRAFLKVLKLQRTFLSLVRNRAPTNESNQLDNFVRQATFQRVRTGRCNWSEVNFLRCI